MKLRLMWLMFIFLVLITIQQCSVMIISRTAGNVKIEERRDPNLDVDRRFNKTIKDTIWHRKQEKN